MIYLISQLWIWLLLALVFAGLAGWAFAAERAAPQQRANRRDRENLLSDILRLSGEPPSGDGALQDGRELDGLRRQLQLRDGRITELERSLETSRERAHDLRPAAGRGRAADRGGRGLRRIALPAAAGARRALARQPLRPGAAGGSSVLGGPLSAVAVQLPLPGGGSDAGGGGDTHLLIRGKNWGDGGSHRRVESIHQA